MITDRLNELIDGAGANEDDAHHASSDLHDSDDEE